MKPECSLIRTTHVCYSVYIKAHLNESRDEESTLVAVMKLLPVISDKLPSCFAAVLAAPGHAADHRHGVLWTNIILHTHTQISSTKINK